MANYDTSIRVGTNIDRKGAEVQLMALENQITKKADKIASLMAKMGEMKDVKLPTQEYQEITSQIGKAEQKLNKLLEKQKQMQLEGKDNGAVWDRLTSQIDETENEIKYAKGELQDLVDTGKAFTLGSDTEEFARMRQQVQYLQNELSVMTQKHDILAARLGSAANTYKKFKEHGQAAFSRIGNLIKKAADHIHSFSRKLKEAARKHLPLFRKETERSKSALSGFGSRLKSLLSGIFIFNVISAGFRRLFSGISEGYQNLYNDNERFKSSVDSLKASFLTLKNALSAAFSPIVEIAIPYIQRLVEWLTAAVNLMGQFIAALTGRKTYIRAIRQSADASEDSAEAVEEETAAMNKQLSPLDQLNDMSSEARKNKEDSSSEAGSGQGIMFEEVPIDSGILDMVGKVKEVLAGIFAPLKEAWEREGEFVMESWKYALDEVWGLIKDIGRDFLEVWQQPATVDMLADILHIIGDIGLTVGHLAHNFREAWNENDTGKKILENIRDILAKIIHNIRLAADKTVEWAKNLNFKPLLEAFERFTESLIPVADTLSGILTDFYTQVILPLGKWVIEEGLPKLLDVFTEFNDRVDWEALRNRLSDFWDHLEPFAETVGEGLILFIENVALALADFINSPEFDAFLDKIEAWMDNVTPQDVADALEKIAKGIIALKVAILGYGAIKTVTGILTTIKSFLAFFGVGGGAAGASGAMFGTAEAAGTLGTALAFIGQALAVAAAAVAGWHLGSWIAEKLGFDPMPFKETMQGIKDSFADGTWKDALKLWGDDIYTAFVTLGERQAEALENIKADIKSVGEFIKNDWNNSYVGQMINSFTDGTWKEALNLWGEDIKADIKSVGEFIKDDWNNSYIGQMVNSFTDGSWKEALKLWGEDIRNAFKTLGGSIKETWNDTWNSIKEKFNSIADWISDKIQWLNNKISGMAGSLSSAFSGGGIFGKGRSSAQQMSAPAAYTADAVIASLNNIEFPAYATGQVIPRTMKQHLAVLGDNNRETEIVSPLSTIKQAVSEAISAAGLMGGGIPEINLDLTVECSGEQLLHLIQKLDREYFKQHGKHALA